MAVNSTSCSTLLPTAFELLSKSPNSQVLQFGLKMVDQYVSSGKLNPVKAWYAGLIYQKNGKLEKAAACFERLASDDAYREQIYKFNAMIELAKWYRNTDAQRSRQHLQNLVRFKEYISVNDQQYKAAKEMLEQLN